MERKLALALLLCSLLCAPSPCQDAAPARAGTLGSLSEEIHSQLEDLRQQSRRLTEQLLTAEQESRESSRRAGELKAELSDLNSCLESTSARLREYSERLTEYEGRLRTRAKVIRAGIALLLLAFAARLALLFAKVRLGIEVPYLLNLIL